MISESNYKECLNYIEKYWNKVTFYLPEDQGTHIALPNKFVSPSAELFKNDQFYWDSYFIILGLMVSGKQELAKGMVDNLIYLFNKFNIIPLRNKVFNLGISQPPFLTSMILEVFGFYKNAGWLVNVAKAAESELEDYWMDLAHNRFSGLSRYCDHFWMHATAEHESGWDMTSRFNERCADYLPIDLNCLLYKYERDLAEVYKIIGDSQKENKCQKKSESRRKKINALMWNSSKGFFFDYDYQNKKQSNFYSLAGFYPLWVGLANRSQAKKIIRTLKKFEHKGGLANTQKNGLSKSFKQWDYPNGWANQQLIVIKGLLNYGYKEDAERLAKKWLDLNKKVFLETGKLWEKYNVVDYGKGKEGRYPMQSGFGWTNAVFVRLIEEFK